MANSIRESSGPAPEELYAVEYTDTNGNTSFRTFKHMARALVFCDQQNKQGFKAVYFRYHLERIWQERV